MSKDKITTINPSTGKEIKSYNQISDSEVNSAIENCQKAFIDWKILLNKR